MSDISHLQFGLTSTFPCSYLEEQEEKLVMLISPEKYAKDYYPLLMSIGFRRSGEDVYRPYCINCQACQSLRIPCASFVLSKSQKRLWNRNKHFTIQKSKTAKESYYPLYERYINEIHSDGLMYPANQEQFDSFITSTWGNISFIEIYDKDILISVSITDELVTSTSSAWSAFYCFYSPDYLQHSLGKYAVLQQLRLASDRGVEFLYLGYYIQQCQKMNYKNQFNPHQRFINQEWLSFP